MSDLANPAPVATGDAVQESANAAVTAFGYKPELRRSLKFFSLFAVAFSVVSISTGLFLNYGFAINSFGPASIWIWPIASVGQILMALIIAELSTKIPVAGYAYQWGARLVNSAYGWFVAAFALLYMLVTVGAIALLGIAPLFLRAIGVDNPNPRLVLCVALIALLIAIAINVISVQITSRVNNLAVFTEIAGTMVLAALLLILWGIHGSHGEASPGILGSIVRTQPGAAWYGFALASLLGIYTLVGFELSADLTEEAVESQRSVPRGVIAGVAISAVLGMIALIAFTLAIPNLHQVEASSLPLVTIADHWMPNGIVRVLVFLVSFSMFALVVVTIAAAGRLVFSLSRDKMLPYSRQLAQVSHRGRTPVPALVTCGIIMLALTWFGYLQTSSFTTLVGATSLAPYLVYLLIVVAYMVKRRTLAQVKGGFNLGRFGIPVIVVALVWIVAACLVLILPSPFHGADKVVGGGFVLALIWYLAVLRTRIRNGQAGVELFAADSAQAEAVTRSSELS
jgi:amino acid transporter